jgi:hypothetical protein
MPGYLFNFIFQICGIFNFNDHVFNFHVFFLVFFFIAFYFRGRIFFLDISVFFKIPSYPDSYFLLARLLNFYSGIYLLVAGFCHKSGDP